jgi:hypothetical protein
MSRAQFGQWGSALDDVAFAEALAGAGVFGQMSEKERTSFLRRFLRPRPPRFGASPPMLIVVAFRAPAIPPAISAEDARALWNTIAPITRRMEVTDAGPLDRSWLARLLSLALPNGLVLLHDSKVRRRHESKEGSAFEPTIISAPVPRMSPATGAAPPAAAPPAPAPPAMPTTFDEPEEEESNDDRFVHARFFDRKDSAPIGKLAPRMEYVLRVHIGPPGEGTKATVPVDESLLPPSDSGHDLTIALFELREEDHAPASRPARENVFLPRAKGESSNAASFPVVAPASGAFVARIVVLHRTRVLQTLIFRAPVGSSEKAFTLEPENIIHPAFDVPADRPAFDAALVVNRAGGKTAVMGVTGTSVTYDEPEGISESITAIGETVGELTRLPDKVKLTDAAVMKVLNKLAHHGRMLHDWIDEKLPSELATARRIQLVEARLGAFLPLEFVYSSFAPKKSAKLCPHGTKELAAAKNTKCPNDHDRDFICLSAFWGFSRVIERWPHMELKNGAEYRLSVPRGKRMKLEPFQAALVGASSRVSDADVKGTLAAIKPLVKSGAHRVADWQSWPGAIGQHVPSLLVLFPHSAEDDGISALEIGKELLQVSSIENDYVCPAEHEPGPLVLLLGCSTQLPRVAFHGFVSRFRMKGAAVVVATLSMIRGRHATRFVNEFLSVLKKRAGKPDAVFGDVLLEAKQQMLAAGDPFALTLVAYGDADWRL